MHVVYATGSGELVRLKHEVRPTKSPQNRQLAQCELKLPQKKMVKAKAEYFVRNDDFSDCSASKVIPILVRSLHKDNSVAVASGETKSHRFTNAHPSPLALRSQRLRALILAMGWRDEWPLMPDGTSYDGKDLFHLTQAGKSPFDREWDVRLLIQEIEGKLNTTVTDIPTIGKGSNSYVSYCWAFCNKRFEYILNHSQGLLSPDFRYDRPSCPPGSWRRQHAGL